jgi:hypothetical protein
MGNAGLSSFAAGLWCRGKLLSHDNFVLELGFVGGVNIVPELVLPVCCSSNLPSHRGFDFPSSQGDLGWARKAVSVSSFWFAIFFQTSYLFFVCFSHALLSLALQYVVFSLFRLLFTEPNGESFYSSAILLLTLQCLFLDSCLLILMFPFSILPQYQTPWAPDPNGSAFWALAIAL